MVYLQKNVMRYELKDVIHYYAGQFVDPGNGDKYMLSIFHDFANEIDPGMALKYNCKLLLRPLFDMTEEEFSTCFRISQGMANDALLAEVKRMARDTIYVRMGYAQYLFSFFVGAENHDERVYRGVSFYGQKYLIEESLVVGDEGMSVMQEGWTNEQRFDAWNQSAIVDFLIKEGFDLHGGIDAGWAIDKTKIK